MDGKLQVNVYRQTEGAPQAGAVVEILEENTNNVVEELVTDSSGKTDIVDLAAPPVEDSRNSENETRPYAVYNLRIRSEGFAENFIDGVQVLPASLATQNAFMLPDERNIEIPDHTLYGIFPPKTPEDEVKPLPPALGNVVLSRPVIPEFIVVHDGVPSDASAANYYVPYTDYIKNVASCEIYSTWPDNSIRANVLAIISFTLNRVYTEW